MKLFIGSPAFEASIRVEQVSTWFSFGVEVAKSSLITDCLIEHIDTDNIDVARNTLTKRALEAKANWLLMVDSDNFVVNRPGDKGRSPGKQILDMLVIGQEMKAAMIAAPIFGRTRANANCLNMHKFVNESCVPYEQNEVIGKVQEVDYIGTGVCAVSLDWLRIKWPEGPWFVTEFGPGLKTQGEDYNFCRGIQERNGKVICDGRFVPAHKSLAI